MPRKPNRLKSYNYSSKGYYHITVDTKGRTPYFGEITKGEVILNKLGKIANARIKYIMHNFPSAKVDEYIVMPNHVHMILILTEASINEPVKDRTKMLISKIIQSYKTSVQKSIKNSLGDEELKIWHVSFHDRIIRSEEELERTREYIRNNPKTYEVEHGW
jgi:REP element-mobilizing transposase RayT